MHDTLTIRCAKLREPGLIVFLLKGVLVQLSSNETQQVNADLSDAGI